MPEVDYRDLATKKYAEWGELFQRMQTDADFFNMVRATTKLADADDHEIPNSVHVILNDIGTFTWEVETELNAAIEQVEVTSENKRFDTAEVERFIRAAFTEADKLLSSKGMFPFNPFIDQQTFRRGRASSFCHFHFDKGEFITDITPWDTKYVVPENDNKGLYYLAGKFYRSESKVLSEYPDAKGNTSSGTNNELLRILTRDTDQIWIGANLVNGVTTSGNLIKEAPNKFGYVPAVYRIVPMGSMLQDMNTIQYIGESGIFLIRLLFKELERIASVIQSLTLKVVDQALQIQKTATDSSGNANPQKTVDELNAPGAVNETPKDSRYELMPLGQLQAAFDILYRMIQERMQRGTSQIYRNIANPPTATQIIMESQEQGNIVMPRLNTRGLLKQDLAYMFIKQTIDAAEKAKVQSVKLGNQEFEVSKLKGEYEIQFKYHFQDPRVDAAQQAIATAQRGFIPDRDIRINTLQREDWEADERQLRWEEAERISPVIKLNRTRRAIGYLADEGEPGAEEELMMITIQEIPALKQLMEGLMTPNMPEELKPSQPLVPLLNESNVGAQGGG